MLRTIPFALAVAFSGLLTGSPARAQFMDLSHIVQQNMAFDQKMEQDIGRISWELALMIPNDEPLPFNAMTISKSINEGNKAWGSYNDAYHGWSNRVLGATDRWIDGAIKGVGNYYNPATGAVQQLPWGPSSYGVNQYGTPYAGQNGYGNTLYPVYGY